MELVIRLLLGCVDIIRIMKPTEGQCECLVRTVRNSIACFFVFLFLDICLCNWLESPMWIHELRIFFRTCPVWGYIQVWNVFKLFCGSCRSFYLFLSCNLRLYPNHIYSAMRYILTGTLRLFSVYFIDISKYLLLLFLLHFSLCFFSFLFLSTVIEWRLRL